MKKNKLNQILDKMYELEIQTTFLFKKENIAYISGFKPSTFSILLLKEEPLLLVSKMDSEESAKLSNVSVEQFITFKEIKEILSKEKTLKLGVEESLPIGICNKLKGDWQMSITDVLSNFRMIKSSEEIEKIKKAIGIAEKSIKEVEFTGKEGEVAANLDYRMRINGSQKEAFETIVASGPRSSLPHAEPSKNELETPVLIDWGAKYNDYCSDTTRTIVYTEKQEEILNIVLEAQKAAIKSIIPGALTSDVDKAARDVMVEYGYADQFIHSTGHGVGLEVHEMPSLSSKDELILKKNMVVTVEPGIYIEGEFGVRIEDMIQVNNKGKVLTKLPSKFCI
jgi:Xaa-Pro dipeptidase